MQKILRNKKIIFGIPVLLLGVFIIFAIPRFAHAGLWDFLSPTYIITTGFKLVSFLINWLLSILFMFAAFLVDIALNFNEHILSSGNSLLSKGWDIVRDVANLGFVIAIIVMAFATILRIESYGSKKLLTNLIIAAILVNFSLAIPGILITFTNSITRFFIGSTDAGASGVANAGLATKLAGAFSPQRLTLSEENPPPPDPSEQGGALSGFGTAVLGSIASLIFGAIFTLIAAIVMFLLAIMLMVRYLILTFLLILSPITWFFWVIPDLKSLFSQWWTNFFKWAFFGPASSFFIYLALTSLNLGGGGDSFSSVLDSLGGGSGTPMKNSPFNGNPLENVMMQGGQMLVVTGILLAGIIVAEKMGLQGATAAVGAAKAGSKIAAKFVGKQALKAPGRIGGGLGKLGGAIEGLKDVKGLGWLGKTYIGAKGLGQKAGKTEVGKWTKDTYGTAKTKFRNAMDFAGNTEVGTFGKDLWKGMKDGSGLFKKDEKKELPDDTASLSKMLDGVAKDLQKIIDKEKKLPEGEKLDKDEQKKKNELQGKRNKIGEHFQKMKEQELLAKDDYLGELSKEIEKIEEKIDAEKAIEEATKNNQDIEVQVPSKTDPKIKEPKRLKSLTEDEKKRVLPSLAEKDILQRLQKLKTKHYDDLDKERKAKNTRGEQLQDIIDDLSSKIESEKDGEQKKMLEKKKAGAQKELQRLNITPKKSIIDTDPTKENFEKAKKERNENTKGGNRIITP